MSSFNKKSFSKEKIEEALKNTNGSIVESSAYLNINRRTFKRIASEYNLYKPEKSNRRLKIDINEILEGKHPSFSPNHLKRKLIQANIKEYKCECCGITEYNGKEISLEVNHKDGNNTNHILNNIELLCPNCHSQTSNYRSKKLKTIL